MAALSSLVFTTTLCFSHNVLAGAKDDSEEKIIAYNEYDEYDARDNVTVNSAEKLLKELIGDSGLEKANNILLTGDATITKKKAIKAGLTADWSKEGFYNDYYTTVHLNSDSIIIEDGGVLTLDGVQFDEYSSYSEFKPSISVQKGGTLKLINGAKIEKMRLVVNEGAVLEMDNSYYEGENFQNYGTVNIGSKQAKNTDMSSSVGFLKIETGGKFVNGTKGVINVKYGYIDIDGSQQWCSDEDNGKLEQAIRRNYGTIKCTEKGGLKVEGSSSEYQTYRPYIIPFINHGTIDIANADKCCGWSIPLQVSYSTFINKGKIKIVKNAYKSTDNENGTDATDAGSIARSADDSYIYNSAFSIYSSKFTNEGTISITAKAGLGASIHGSFYNPDYYDSSYYGVTKSKKQVFSQFINEKGGKIELKSAYKAVAFIVGKDTTLINKGSVNISSDDTKTKVNNADLLLVGKLQNKGSVVNNGRIGFCCNYELNKNMGYEGTKYTGKGTEAYLYTGCVRAKETKNGEVIYFPEGAKVTYTANKKTINSRVIKDSGCSSDLFLLFLDKGTSATVNVKVQAYGNANLKFTSAKNLAAYEAYWKKDIDHSVSKIMSTKLTKVTAPTITKTSNSKAKTVSVTFKKVSGVKGYEVKYANSNGFYNYDKTWVKTTTTTKTTLNLSGFKKGETAYVMVRAYKIVDKIKVYSDWTEVQTVTIKK